MNINPSNDNSKVLTLTDPIVLDVLLMSLKALHKQQELKKKNHKKLINSFSIKVQKYNEGNASTPGTGNELKQNKTNKMLLSVYSKKKKATPNVTEYSHNSDSSISMYANEERCEDIDIRPKYSSLSTTIQNERMKVLKHKFAKQIENSKKFRNEVNYIYDNNTYTKPKGEIKKFIKKRKK